MAQENNKIHEIKIYPTYYQAIARGEKTFELRKNDRNYKVGDVLKLKEWDGENFTGHRMMRKITYIYHGANKYGLSEGFCILSIKKV